MFRFLLCLCCCLYLLPLRAKKTTYSAIIVGFYNCENLYDTLRNYAIYDEDFTPSGSKHYTHALYKEKIDHLAQVISQLGKDINLDGPALLGVAEIENKAVLEDICQHPLLKKNALDIVHRNSRDARGVDVALLYRRKYFKVLSVRNYPMYLPNTRHRKAHYTRDILHVKGALLHSDTLHVFVLHLPSRLGGQSASEPARMYVTRATHQIIDSLRQTHPHHKFIVMGDMNDNPDNRSIKEVFHCVGDRKKITPDNFYNPWENLYKKGAGTLAYNDAWSLFDQILLSHHFLTDTSGCYFYKPRIFNAPYLIETKGKYKGYPKRTFSGDTYNRGYSDHFPVFIVLLKKRSLINNIP